MKKYLLTIMTFMICTVGFAQYKVKTEVMESSKKYGPTKPTRTAACLPQDNKKTIKYTPQYYATRAAMNLSGAFISFQEIDNTKYIYIDFALFGALEFKNKSVSSFTFLFKDGTKLNIPISYSFNSIDYSSLKGVAVDRVQHTARAMVTDEQLELFTKKQLISIGIDFKSPDKSFNGEVVDKKSYEVAMRAAYFLRGEKLKPKDIEKVFTENETKAIQDSNWDF